MWKSYYGHPILREEKLHTVEIRDLEISFEEKEFFIIQIHFVLKAFKMKLVIRKYKL